MPAMPRPVHYAPGEVVNVRQGVFYVDPRSGAVDGWQIPGEPVPWPFQVSPRGRYIAYGRQPSTAGSAQPWRLFDTQSGEMRDLSYGPPHFSPDDARYAVDGPDGISIVRSDDGTVEQTVPLARFREPLGFTAFITWAPDGTSLLVGYFDQPQTAPVGRVTRVDLASGTVTDVADGALPVARWSPDGRTYYVIQPPAGALVAFDAATNRERWTLALTDLGFGPSSKPGSPPGEIALPYISPDGRRAAIAVRGTFEQPAYRVYVLDAASGAIQFWIDGALTCPQHAWTAAGRWLLVSGRRGDQGGSFLAAADGSALRFVREYVGDLSPVDPNTAGVHGGGMGLAELLVIDIPGGGVRRSVQFAGDIGWDATHHPLWLPDGRMVVHAPHGGHGGCGEGPADPQELAIRFP
jgi:hypothetical protein